MRKHLIAPTFILALLASCSGGDVKGARTAWMAFNIEQRHTKELDDLSPGLSVRIDDITNGKTFLTVYVDGETYSGPKAAEFLEKKWNSQNAIIRTKAAFIDKIATKSETTDQYYMVVLEDGKQVPLANWLRYLD
jgi:hypothetical protein